MGLNIVSSGGNFLPYCKYNAKADKWFFKNGDKEQEVVKPAFVADFENIRTGWFLFLEGQAPSVTYDVNLSTPAAKPSDQHKRGFNLQIYSQQVFGGVVELSGASMHLCNAINNAYLQYEKDKGGVNEGKLPVIECQGAVAHKDKFGTNYEPTLVISKWVDRPEAFTEALSKRSKPQPANQSSSVSAPPQTEQKKAVSEF